MILDNKNALKFKLTFFMYDKVTQFTDQSDYVMEKDFKLFYRGQIETLQVFLGNSIFLSQKRPKHEVRIDHLEGKGQYDINLPQLTYAYTTL